MDRTDFRHLILVTVHWGDMDSLGHLNDPAIWGGEGPILVRTSGAIRERIRSFEAVAPIE